LRHNANSNKIFPFFTLFRKLQTGLLANLK